VAMLARHYSSFQRLAARLEHESRKTFTQRWENSSYQTSLPEHFRFAGGAVDFPGEAGTVELPKYLYRGEPDLFSATRSSWARLVEQGRFGEHELKLLKLLSDMALNVTNIRVGNRSRAGGFAQHYGFPTRYVDLTSDPTVALHFAASTTNERPPKKRVVWRLDLQGIDKKTYVEGAADANRFAADPAPLTVAHLEQHYFTRARRQRAWVISARTDEFRFNLQRSWHLWRHVKKFTVDSADADRFRRPDLESAEDDPYAPWPLAIVRALKVVAGGGLPQALADWICGRIPLYEWTPVDVYYDGKGRGTRVHYYSPAEATKQNGRDYRANREAVVEELVAPEIGMPNGIVFGQPSGGMPNTMKRFEPGSECEVQWFGAVPQPLGVSYRFPGDPVKVPFEQQYGVWDNYKKVVLR
jgi:FRG domain